VFEQERAMAAASFAPKNRFRTGQSQRKGRPETRGRAHPNSGADRFASFYQSETEQGATTGGARSLRWAAAGCGGPGTGGALVDPRPVVTDCREHRAHANARAVRPHPCWSHFSAWYDVPYMRHGRGRLGSSWRSVQGAVALIMLLSLTGIAQAEAGSTWAASTPSVAKDLMQGHPLVVLVVVPLCSNSQIDCGGNGLAAPGRPGGRTCTGVRSTVARRFFERARARLMSGSRSTMVAMPERP